MITSWAVDEYQTVIKVELNYMCVEQTILTILSIDDELNPSPIAFLDDF